MSLVITKPDFQRKCKALIYGPSGQGKTVFLGTAQQDERTAPMLLISFEGGTSSLAGLDIDIAQVHSWSDHNDIFSFLRKPNKYKSIGVDSLSESHFLALLLTAQKRSGGDGDVPSDDFLAPEKVKEDPDYIEMGDYGRARVQILRLMRLYRDLPLHVFFTALSMEDRDVREGLIKKPYVAGKLSDEVLGIPDIVAYMAVETSTQKEVQTSKRILLLQNYPKIRCKVRTPWKVTIPNEIENPTVSSLLDVLQIQKEGNINAQA